MEKYNIHGKQKQEHHQYTKPFTIYLIICAGLDFNGRLVILTGESKMMRKCHAVSLRREVLHQWPWYSERAGLRQHLNHLSPSALSTCYSFGAQMPDKRKGHLNGELFTLGQWKGPQTAGFNWVKILRGSPGKSIFAYSHWERRGEKHTQLKPAKRFSHTHSRASFNVLN